MNGIVILDRANVPLGPFTREQVAEKLRRGEVTPDSLAFVEGLTQWTPLREVLARVDAANPLPPIPTPPPLSVPTPAPAPPRPGAVPVPLAPSYSYAATMAPPSHLVYAGFWLRVAAHLIDLAVLSVAILALVFAFVFGASMFVTLPNSQSVFSSDLADDPGAALIALALELVICLVCFVMVWLYHALLESGPWQGTLGKRVLNLRITSMSGERISFWHATGRFLAWTVAALPFGIGYLMVAFTERKQALHDMIASTLVVQN
jgi:uncharacterized RDD family membrane protein YckC